MPNIRGIKYVSLAEPSGYGIAGKRCLLGLAQSGIPITWAPMIPGAGGPLHYGPFKGRGLGDAELDRFCNRPIDYDVVIVHTVPEYFPFWVDAERGRTIIGHTVWETTAIPKHWPPLLNAVDHLIVPCHWNREVFKQCGVTTPIDILPHVADTTPVGPAGPLDDDGYVFYTIGTWTRRKAIDRTVTAFCEAFTADDRTTLVIKTNPDNLTATGPFRRFRRSAGAVRRVTRRYKRPPRIRLITDDLTDAQMRQLHARGDCYLSLCRAEGWGIGAFDAATYGRPVVITAFGGQLDYLEPDLAYLIDYELVPVTEPQAPLSYSPDQRWAEPDIRHAAKILREIVADPDQARAKGLGAQRLVLERFDEQTVTETLIGIIQGAQRRRPAARDAHESV